MATIDKSKKLYLSASRVKQFLDCSWSFYANYILKIPDVTHPKTKLGTLIHLILELLQNPRHKKHYDIIIAARDVFASKGISRIIKSFLAKNPDITEDIAYHLNDLIFVALDYDFFSHGARQVLPPEYSFEIDFDDFSIKGFIDKLALYDSYAIVTDYKTQGKKFTKTELTESVQAVFYQLAVDHLFKLPAQVNFLLLRHPATSKNKYNFLQSVKAPNKYLLEGFKLWLKEINSQILALDEERAKTNFKACSNKFFCEKVCSLKDPFDYYVIIDKDGNERGKYRSADVKLNEGEKIEIRKYTGCPYFWHADGRQRNFQSV